MRFEIGFGGGLLIVVALVGLSGAVFTLGLVAGYQMAGQEAVREAMGLGVYPVPSPPAAEPSPATPAGASRPAPPVPALAAAPSPSPALSSEAAEVRSTLAGARPPPPAPSAEKLSAHEPAAAATVEASGAALTPSNTGTEHRARPSEPRLASSPPPAPKHQPYSIQIEALMDREGADKMVSRLRARGYEPYVVETEVDGKTWYRVRVGRYQSQAEAHDAEVKLHQQFGGPTSTH